jgi:hypothetical protein
MIAEGRRHVIVNAEPMRDVNFESLAQVLEVHRESKFTTMR